MSDESATPEGSLAATSGGRINEGSGRIISLKPRRPPVPDGHCPICGRYCTLPRNLDHLKIVLPTHVIPLLRDEGIVTVEHWLELGKQRFRLFGITPRTIEALDQAAEAVQE